MNSLYVVLILVIVVIAIASILSSNKRKSIAKEGFKVDNYVLRNALLTQSERKLYFALKEIVKDMKDVEVFAKVRLLNIIDTRDKKDKVSL